jgi:hypothetical protein
MSGSFPNPLQRHGPGIVSKARLVKQWTREALVLDDEAIVSVSEVACALPGCPPRETIILVMGAERATRQVSIHRPLTEVNFKDVEAVWRAIAV